MPAILAVAVLVLAAAPIAPERQNALAFDNGAFLLQEGGSYGQGVSGWAAWNLADGDETVGWCSPQNKPVGLAFVWELDTTWTVDTFAVSTRNMQDDGYPGVSARTVELQVGDGTAFRKVGTFQVGVGERKEFPLPKGTSARQVKLVVVANHGNPEYTEIAEVELFGTRSGAVAPPRIAGDFSTRYGPMRFAVEGDEVYGCYDFADGAVVYGSVVGRTARVTWSEPSEEQAREGTATFAVSPDGKELRGVWYEGGELKGEWSGSRVDPDEGPRCTPRRKGQLETLRKQKRLVLYGIRFD